jgi:glycosyltransferase involved in cell wall biosynthesis
MLSAPPKARRVLRTGSHGGRAPDLKLLFLTQTYPRFAGDTSGPFIQDLARALVRAGDAVTVLAPHAPGVARAWDDAGVAVRTFRYAPDRFESLGYSRSLDADERVKPAAAVVAPLYVLAARRALRRLLEAERFDLLHAHWIVPNGLVAAPLGKRVLLAIGLHGSDVFLAEKPLVRSRVAGALRRTALMTGCSPELVDRVAALGIAGDRCHVIPYGVDTELFHPGDDGRAAWRARLGIPATAQVVLAVGRMATKKGFQVLVPELKRLLERHPACHVVLAGGGDRLEELRRATSSLAARVHLPGVVYRDALPGLYRAADLFVLPAVHDAAGNVDGLPNVILEAMASGLPVVASGISGIPLAVVDGRTGVLVREGDGGALSGALDRLLHGWEEARAMGVAGRRRALSDLTWGTVAGRYRMAYRAAVARASGRPAGTLRKAAESS